MTRFLKIFCFGLVAFMSLLSYAAAEMPDYGGGGGVGNKNAQMGCDSGTVCVKLASPFEGAKTIEAKNGKDFLKKYASYIYKYVAGITGLIAVIVLVVSGVQMMTAGVDENQYSAAKDRIVRTLGGVALLFCMAAILYTANPIYFTP